MKLTLNGAIDVLRAYAEQGDEVYDQPCYDAWHRQVPGTDLTVAVTRCDDGSPAALYVWREGDAEMLVRLDEGGPVVVMGDEEDLLALAQTVLGQKRRVG